MTYSIIAEYIDDKREVLADGFDDLDQAGREMRRRWLHDYRGKSALGRYPGASHGCKGLSVVRTAQLQEASQ